MAASGDGQNSEGGRSLLILLGTPSVVSALGGTALVLIIFTFSLSVVCLLSKRKRRARTPLRLPQDANPDTEHRQASETLNTGELEASPTPHPPIPVHVTEWLIPPVVSKASNETETTILDDGDSESQSEAGSVFEEEIVVTGTCGLSSPSMTQTPTPELPRRTSDMYITADGLSSLAQTPELPRRTNDMYITADGLSCRSCSVPPDLPPRTEALSCCSGSHGGGLDNSAENLSHTQSASIKSLLSEDYDRLETFRGKSTERRNNSAFDSDIPTEVNNHSNGVVTVDIAEMSGDDLDDKNTDKAMDETSELANYSSTSAFSETKEPLFSVQEDDQPPPLPPPIPPRVKSSHSVVGMERPNTGKRAPRPPPAIMRASSDAPPPPPLPPKRVSDTERSNIALPPRNIRRNVNSVDGSVPPTEVDSDTMALKFNASYQTFIEHFYNTK